MQMHPIVYAVMAFGIFLAIAGILLLVLVQRVAEEKNELKIFGIHFTGGSSSLVLVLGVIVFLSPFLRKEDFPEPPPIPQPARPSSQSEPEGKVSDEAIAYVEKGFALYDLRTGTYKDPDTALRYFTLASSLHPREVRFILPQVQIRLQLEDYQRALVLAEAAVATNPSFPDVYLYRGMVFGNMGKLKQACKDFKRGKDLGSTHAAGWFNSRCND